MNEEQIVLSEKDVAADLGAIDPAAVPSVDRPDGQPGFVEQYAGAELAGAQPPPVAEKLRTPPPRRGPGIDPDGVLVDVGEAIAPSSRDVLSTADQIIHGERAAAYGPAEESFARIGALWSVHLGIPVDAYDVAVMMVLMKASRAKTDLGRDTPVDIAGYAALMPRCAVHAGRTA